MTEEITAKLNLYRHYKNKPYKFLGYARHSETLERLVLYETLYENELDSNWVRPENLFFGKTEIDGQIKPRFQQVKMTFRITTNIQPEDIDNMNRLLCEVFGGYDKAKLSTRIMANPSPLLISAYLGEQFCGFKLGYALSEEVFYSWLGAVAPDFRGIGLGQSLMTTQHNRLGKEGYSTVQTKTLNKWKAMLLLNIKNGFQISGTETRESGEIKIKMEKPLRSIST